MILRDRYRLDALLGAGAQGVTYLAEHLFVNYPCVVKILHHPVRDARDASVRRLRAEASAGFRVNDPHVVRVLDGDVFRDTWFFVMEYVDGLSFAPIASRRALPWKQVAKIASEAAAGLVAIQRAGLRHGDVKPGNLLLGRDGRCRLADLGVAAALGAVTAGSPTEPLVYSGTVAYAAPELFRGGGAVDDRADLYSLGMTLFELAAGRLPFSGDSPLRMMVDSQCRTPAWPSDAPTDVPEWLVRLILRLLAPEPAERFTSARELAAQLSQEPARRPVTPEAPTEHVTPLGVAVPVFRNAAGADADDWLGQALADHLARCLWQHSGLFVVDRDELARVQLRVSGQQSDPTRAPLAAARLLGAATIFDGEFERVGTQIRVSIRSHGHDGASRIGQVRVEGSLAALVELQGRLYTAVAAMMGLAAADPTAAPVLAAPPSASAQENLILAKRAYLRGDYSEAMRIAQRALETDPEHAEAVGFLGVCQAKIGRYEEAIASHRHQEQIAQRLNDPRLVVEARANMGAMYYFRGDYEAAYDVYAAAITIAERHRMSVETAKISNNLGYVLFQLARAPEAEAAYLRAIKMHRTQGALVSLIGPYNGMGNVLRESGRIEEAITYHRRALALAEESEDRVNVGICYVYLGRCAAQLGRYREAKQDLASALNILDETQFWNGLARAYESMTELNLRLGDWTEAARCADKRIDLARQHANQRMQAAAWRQKAEALERSGLTAQSAECIAFAEQLEAQAGARA
ncbi:MAG: tetratricopeptide repeat protein [Planctomycetes bacterium]|nr:tetratricopeptide repeat protein [Planctomycetota bacterium]